MYEEYLKQILMPLRIYELESGIGAEELAVIGEEMDKLFDALEEIRREAFLATAESYGLRNFEGILPFTPASLTTEDERRAVMALLRIRGGCFTQPMLQDTISGCGLQATVAESSEQMTVEVRFPHNRGIPDGFAALKKRVEEIVPCHLATEYVFIYTPWQSLMEKLLSWGDAQERAGTWKALEIYE